MGQGWYHPYPHPPVTDGDGEGVVWRMAKSRVAKSRVAKAAKGRVAKAAKGRLTRGREWLPVDGEGEKKPGWWRDGND